MSAEPISGSSAAHIFVIDDDADVRQLWGEYLGQNDIRVSAGSLVLDLCALLEQQTIDLERAGEVETLF